MRFRLAVLAMLVIGIFAVSVGSISAQVTSSSGQEQEGNDLGDEGRVLIPFLEDGVEMIGEIVPGISATLFTFDGTAGDKVTISVTQITDGFDPYIVLLGPRGEVVAADDDSGDVSLSALIEDVELPTDGSYLIQVSSAFSASREADSTDTKDAREFEIEVTGNNAPVNNPDYSETSLLLYRGEIEVGGTTNGFSDASEPVYYYIFEATEGQELDIVIDEADFDTLIMVFGQNGERIALNDDDPDGGLTSAIRGFEVPADGAYMLFVTTFRFQGVDSDYEGGTFTLSISES